MRPLRPLRALLRPPLPLPGGGGRGADIGAMHGWRQRFCWAPSASSSRAGHLVVAPLLLPSDAPAAAPGTITIARHHHHRPAPSPCTIALQHHTALSPGAMTLASGGCCALATCALATWPAFLGAGREGRGGEGLGARGGVRSSVGLDAGLLRSCSTGHVGDQLVRPRVGRAACISALPRRDLLPQHLPAGPPYPALPISPCLRDEACAARGERGGGG